MRKNIFVFMILGACVSLPAMAASYEIGTFIAPKGADGRDGTNGTNGTNGTAGCSPRIYQTNKTGGCYQIKSQAQKRVSGVCTDDTSINAVTLDNICDGCTPTYSKKYIHGSVSSPTYNDNSANAIGTRVTVSGCDANPVNIDTYDGDDGTSFNYLGTVANCDALPTSPTPSANDAYLVKGTGLGRVCIYTGSGWPTCPDDCAEFTGPAGDNNCTGLEASPTAVKNTTLTYSGPTKSDSGLSYYTTKGKMTTSHTPCNPNATIDDSVQDDSCTLIAAPSGSTCTGSKKTYYECKTQAADGSLAKGVTYNLCVSTAGDSISNALDGKEDTACVGSDSNSASVERKKTVSYTAPTGNGAYGTYSWKTTVGKVENKSVACSGATTLISSTPDKCEEVTRPNANVCSGTSKVYYQCTQQNNGSTYNLCTSGTSVLDKIDTAQSTANNAASAAAQAQTTANGKIDASYLSTNGYLTSNSNLNAGKLTGTIDSERLPSTVVTVGDDATHGLNTLLSSALSTGTLKDVVTSGTLNGYVKTTGTENNSISTILSNNNVVTTTNVGSCQAGTTTGKNTPVTCSDNSLAGQLLDALLPAINAAAGGNTVVRQ